eukprot:4348281-Lingulodinium_polyedra.AAC.1
MCSANARGNIYRTLAAPIEERANMKTTVCIHMPWCWLPHEHGPLRGGGRYNNCKLAQFPTSEPPERTNNTMESQRPANKMQDYRTVSTERAMTQIKTATCPNLLDAP